MHKLSSVTASSENDNGPVQCGPAKAAASLGGKRSLVWLRDADPESGATKAAVQTRQRL